MPRLATTLRRRSVSLAGRSRGQMGWRLQYGHSRTYGSVGRGTSAEFCSPSSVTPRKTASPTTVIANTIPMVPAVIRYLASNAQRRVTPDEERHERRIEP